MFFLFYHMFFPQFLRAISFSSFSTSFSTDRTSFSLCSFLMRQVLPAMRRSTASRMAARTTIQGNVLGMKGSEKGARNVPFTEKKETQDESAPQEEHLTCSLGSLLQQLPSQKPQVGKGTDSDLVRSWEPRRHKSRNMWSHHGKD